MTTSKLVTTCSSMNLAKQEYLSEYLCGNNIAAGVPRAPRSGRQPSASSLQPMRGVHTCSGAGARRRRAGAAQGDEALQLRHAQEMRERRKRRE
eukprot:CAMPEP_0180071954 /NCGR_PEP_ID=MMETSP0985-20121206/12443_1 /TAXON_ID=483367 /ORGANISM="non described non described, Strain CCMP 2436" /LENGTH=93 /DNA_ID=CAMNT_0022003263 /DNA_START=9 /DNA_END=291 /DNA_ORIENTATION=-